MILHGDCREVLPTLEAGSVQACVTSPPYFGLRSYEGGPSEIGAERLHDCQAWARDEPGNCGGACYICRLVLICRKARRVLRDDGLLWVNIGDSYSRAAKWGGATGGKHPQALHGAAATGRRRSYPGIPNKNLLGIPWRLALALQADGWILRSSVIWAKKSCMPESVGDRPTRSHEHVLMLAKSPSYYYDAEAIGEPAQFGMKGSTFDGGKTGKLHANTSAKARTERPWRNRRDVWRIAAQPFSAQGLGEVGPKGAKVGQHVAHPAPMPPRLAELMILASTRPGDTVLDPFAGSGAVLCAAQGLGREPLGIEINPDFCRLATARLQATQPGLPL